MALVTRRFRAPLLWSVLDHRGNSNTGQRVALVQRYLAQFEPASIDLRLVDREFIGADWMAFLIGQRVPFAIRVKPDLFMALADGSLWSIETLLRTRRAHHTIHALDLFLPDSHLPVQLTWIYKAATFTKGMRVIARKAHGRRQKSWFRTGFDALRNAMLHAPQIAATLWIQACPRRIRRP